MVACLVWPRDILTSTLLTWIDPNVDSLKKNPVMGEDELEQVAPGLGGEAVQEGLAGVSSKLGGLGKF
jgi:hypothetical protein